MKIFTMDRVVILILIFSSFHRTDACHLLIDHLDSSNILRQSYERDVFNITGELRSCPSSLEVMNISIINPDLKRLSILNVSYFLETRQINITTFARFIGIAPLTIQFYLRAQSNEIPYSLVNGSAEERACAMFSLDRDEILHRCSMLKFENASYHYSQTIDVAIKRHQTIIDNLFTTVILFLVMIGTLCIGCGLELDQILENWKKPLPLFIGSFCQIIYVPLLSFGITKIFRLDRANSLGLISTASSPGSFTRIFVSLFFQL